jgi:adenine phosphoribosyltransferase
MNQDLAKIKSLIRTIPDFPKPGILFRDVTTLLMDPWGLRRTVDALAEHFLSHKIDKVVGIESRGFIVGAPVALSLNCGLVLARKKGKLPGAVAEMEYDLEYGKDCIQIHNDAIRPGERCLIIDDLLATGGTANATANLVEKLGGKVAGIGFIINLPDLHGAEKLARYDLKWLVDFEGH